MKTVVSPLDDAQTLVALGVAIRRLRKERAVSQEELAHVCQLDRSHLGRIERGERNVTLLNVVRIARGLACTPSDLLLAAGL